MHRTQLSLVAVAVLGLLLLLGCGGGGGHHGTDGTDGTTGTVPTNSGVVRTLDGTPIAGATVRFYGATGTTVLGTTTTSSTGVFSTVPSGARRFSVSASRTSYYGTYAFDGLYYDDSLACYPTLPTPGSAAGFTSDIVFFVQSSGTVPPPPNGCVGT